MASFGKLEHCAMPDLCFHVTAASSGWECGSLNQGTPKFIMTQERLQSANFQAPPGILLAATPVIWSLDMLWPHETRTAKFVSHSGLALTPTAEISTRVPVSPRLALVRACCSHSWQFCSSLPLVAWPPELNDPSERVLESRILKKTKKNQPNKKTLGVHQYLVAC